MNQFDDLGSMSLSRLFIFDLCLFKEWPIPVALFRVPTGARCTEPVLLGDLGTIQQDSSTGLAGGWGPGEVSSNGNRTVKSREGNQMEVSIQSHVVPQARWMVYESWKILAMIAMNGWELGVAPWLWKPKKWRFLCFFWGSFHQVAVRSDHTQL
jgi:hypothetical protein